MAIVLLTLWCTCALRSCAVRGTARRPPNVLFIAIDDLNDWVGALEGHPQTSTPNLDRLAERGLLFTNAHAPAPACNPSRTATLTGLRPSTTGVYGNRQPFRAAYPELVTLPQHFRAHGYKTLGAGKMFHDRFPDPESWDRYFPRKGQQRFYDDPEPARTPGHGIEDMHSFDWGAVDVEEGRFGDARVTAWIAERLRRRHRKPFFMACGIFRPHLPWYVPRADLERLALADIELPPILAGDLDDVPLVGRGFARKWNDHERIVAHGRWASGVRGYLAAIAFADRQLGTVLDALWDGPNADNTIVVLWSDHGWHLGEKEHWRKFTLWERATRVPLVIVAPGVTRPGQRSARAVNLVDLYPTLIELTGLPPRAELDGVSLAPLLRDPEAAWSRPSLTTHGRGNHALRSETHRYIRYRDGGEELYDLTVDPNEWHNLVGTPGSRAVINALAPWLPARDAPNVPASETSPAEDAEEPVIDAGREARAPLVERDAADASAGRDRAPTSARPGVAVTGAAVESSPARASSSPRERAR